ncbi:hypothetical protein ILUMI_22857 [Ignelater luminosus]|uniref:Uncharacterized protein n=1 Tax=Ignelater luminosus TaxID=2038154 RepID=A0A8K0C9C5_IGNLU|nr:hypothetical protein ILUMI_22857 [Ignelater luminosus]
MCQWLLVITIIFTINTQLLNAARPVTNEDIRDAILSVVNMIRSTGDKLERHEYRERTLGDQLKKALTTIDKRQRLMDPIKGTLGRLDERLATVETILMQKDERERIQMQKTFDMVEQIHRSLPQLFETLKNDIITSFPKDEAKPNLPPPDTPLKSDLQKLQKEIETKIDTASSNAFKDIEGQLTKIWEENKKNNKLHEHASSNLEDVKRHINNSEQVLEKYENKLAEYNNRIDVLPSNDKAQDDMHVNILQALDVQKSTSEQILADVKAISSKVQKIPESSDIELIRNDTFKSVEELKYEVIHQAGKTISLVDGKYKELQNKTDETNKNLQTSLNQVGEMMEILTGNVATSFEQLRTEVRALGKLEQVMVQTADGVIDTKRRVEYGVHQILLEVGDLIKTHSKETNATINERFDNFELSVLDTENGALANISSKISSEIDQVWRQIGIMHQQMSASTDTLDKLQNQTDSYVNGSVNTMDAMRSKVAQITSRMLEVDDNLNYLLGRLSLITQEFNQIKSGLGQALDEIKDSFNAVQKKLKDAGPGPHQISSNEIDANSTNKK